MSDRKKLLALLLTLMLGAAACRGASRLIAGRPTPALEPVALAASETPTRPPTEAPTSTPTHTPTPEPSSTPTQPLPSPSPSPTPTVSPADTERQQAVFEELWQIVADEYLYPDFNGLDWDAVHTEYRQQIAAGISDEEFYLAMEEMIARLGDEHSAFFSPVQAQEEDEIYAGETDYVGIGVLTTTVPERRRVTVLLVFPDSPAEEAGLKPHDSLLAVDGEPLIDEEGIRRNLLRGPAGDSLELTVQSPGQEPRLVTITRRKVSAAMPVPYQVLVTQHGKRVGYLMLATFNDIHIGDEVEKALRAMSARGRLDGLIVDDRQNGGGSSVVFEKVLAFFTRGVAGEFVQRSHRRALNIIGIDIQGSLQVPLVVLVGPDTASFGEIFAGILQDQQRAYLIGEPTGGNVEILWVYELSDGSRAWIAHEFFRPDRNPDQDWEQTGIIPEEVQPAPWDEYTLESDPAVQAALGYLDVK